MVVTWRKTPELELDDLDAIMKAGLCLASGAAITMGVCSMGWFNSSVCGFLRAANSA